MKKILPMALFIVLLFLSSCIVQKEHTYYIQDPHITTLFKEKHEFDAYGFISGSKNTSAAGMNAAFALTGMFSIAAGYQLFRNSSTETVDGMSTGQWHGNSTNLALGWFKDFKEKGILEIYCGVSVANQTHFYSVVEEKFNGSFFVPGYTAVPSGSADFTSMKYYIQPNYGFSSDHFDVIFSTRFSSYNVTNFENKVTKGTIPYKEVKMVGEYKSLFFLEPAVTFRAGWKNLKFQMQVAYTMAGVSSIGKTMTCVGLQLTLNRHRFDNTANIRN